MLCEKRELLPHAWITGDDEMGRSSGFRRDLRELGETYLLAVPSNTLVRDLDAAPPAYGGTGQPPKMPFMRVDRWREKLSRSSWTQVDVRDGEKGPLIVDVATCRVVAMQGRRIGAEEILVVIRRRDEQSQVIHDYYLSNAPAETPLSEFARVAKAEHRIEEAIHRGKSEAGLADYEVRTWQGWYHHQTLSLMATWFLVQETRRGKKWTPAITVPQVRERLAQLLRTACDCDGPIRIARECTRRLERNQLARFYHWKRRNSLPPLNINKRRF